MTKPQTDVGGKRTDCCGSPNYLERTGKNGKFYVCEGCYQACDLVTPPPQTEQKCEPDAFEGMCQVHHVPIEKCWANQPQTEQEIEEQVKGTILRPLADKFQELARQIDSEEREVPKTLEEAKAITEDFIDQAYKRLKPILTASNRELLERLLSDIDDLPAVKGNLIPYEEIEGTIEAELKRLGE